MTEKEKFDELILKGYKYDGNTGDVFGKRGKPLTKKSHGYVMIGNIRAHRFAWYYIHKEVPNIVDHINRVRDDNRIVNLRVVSRLENNLNSKRYDDVKLYSNHKQTGKYTAQICINYKKIHIGIFDTPEEAIKARLDYENKLK
jgi:hypothetical protein